MNIAINFFNEPIEYWERPASWRLQSAMRIIDTPHSKQFTNFDVYSLAIIAVLEDEHKLSLGEISNELELYDPARAAYELWQDYDMRWQVNGYILAGAADEHLVTRFAYSIAVFEHYRKICFDVEAVRDHDDLLDHVLALEQIYSLDPQEEMTWQHIALTCDVEAFDMYIQDTEGKNDIATKDKLKILATQGSMRKALTISMKASLVTPNAFRVLERGAEPMHIEQQSTLDMEKAELDNLVGQLLESIPYRLIKTDDKLPDNAGDFRPTSKMHHRHAEEVNKLHLKAKLEAGMI